MNAKNKLRLIVGYSKKRAKKESYIKDWYVKSLEKACKDCQDNEREHQQAKL